MSSRTCTRLRMATFFLVRRNTPPIARFSTYETSLCIPDRQAIKTLDGGLIRGYALCSTFIGPVLAVAGYLPMAGGHVQKNFSQIRVLAGVAGVLRARRRYRL